MPCGGVPRLAFVGAGRVALALSLALQRRGVAVVAVGARQPEQAQVSWATQVDLAGQGAWPPRMLSPQAAVDAAELVFLTVPDDALAEVAASLRWREGQAVVHCSGASELSVLAPARQAGACVGGFHPLQIFSDPVLAADRLAGCSVAIEAVAPLEDWLQQLSRCLGLHALRLPAEARARYHAAAGYAASSLLPLLQEAAALWRSFGLDEADCMRALLPLARGTLDAVQARGVAGALSGPISRGDAAVLVRHRAALSALGPTYDRLYCELGQRQLALAKYLGRLSAQQLHSLHNALAALAGDSSTPSLPAA